MARPKTIRELLVAIGIKADAKALASFDQQLVRVKGGMASAARGAFLLTAAVVATTAVLFRIAQSTAVAGDEAAKMGRRVGLTAEEVQELGFAAEISGAGLTDVEAGLRRVSKNARDAQRGLSTAVDAFSALGIEFEKAPGQLKDPLELLLDSAEAFKGLTSDTEKAALAQELFGRGGVKLLPLLVEGREGIEALREEARELGFVIGDEGAAAAERFIDAQTEARKVVEGLRNTIGVALMPVLTDMLEGFRDWFVANRDVIKQRVERAADRIAEAFREVGRVIVRVDRFVRERVGGWERIFQALAVAVAVLAGAKFLGGLISVLSGVAAAIQIIGGAIAAVGLSTFALLIASLGVFVAELVVALAPLLLMFAAISLATEDLIVFLRGGESVIGAFFDRFEAGRRVLPAILSLFESATTSGQRMLSLLSRLAAVVGQVLNPALTATQTTLSPLGPILDRVLVGLRGFVELAIGTQITELERWASILDFVALVLDRVTAAIDRFLVNAGDVGGFLRELVKIQQTTLTGALGKSGATFVTGAVQGATGIGPGALPGGFTPGGGGAGGGGPVTVEGDTITINGTNLSAGEIRDLMEERDRQKRRATSAALQGGEL